MTVIVAATLCVQSLLQPMQASAQQERPQLSMWLPGTKPEQNAAAVPAQLPLYVFKQRRMPDDIPAPVGSTTLSSSVRCPLCPATMRCLSGEQLVPSEEAGAKAGPQVSQAPVHVFLRR